MLMRRIWMVFMASLLATPLAAETAQSTQAAAPSGTAQQALSEGLVRKVDIAAGKVTLRHGPLANLGMPGMTMVFKLQDPAGIRALQPGDKIRFRAERVAGTITVIHYEKLP